MRFEGGCYCGKVRYIAEGEPVAKVQCHCRACQHVTGGGPNLLLLMPREHFRYTHGEPKQFTRADIPNAVTREFCAECGTQVAGHRPGLNAKVLKVGTLDDPAQFGMPQAAIFTAEMQAFHHIPEGMPTFTGAPPRR